MTTMDEYTPEGSDRFMRLTTLIVAGVQMLEVALEDVSIEDLDWLAQLAERAPELALEKIPGDLVDESLEALVVCAEMFAIVRQLKVWRQSMGDVISPEMKSFLRPDDTDSSDNTGPGHLPGYTAL